MKKIVSLFLIFGLLTISSLSVFAIPPYFGVSVSENLSFQQQTCISTAKKVLKQDGFQKIVQFKSSMTLFAAYQNKKPYHYKALVKCLSESGVIFVVVVANVPKQARQKAENLRREIQQSTGAEHNQNVPLEEEYTGTEYTDEKCQCGTFESQAANNVTEDWQNTLFSQQDCLIRGEISLRESGFYQEIDFNNDSVYANHPQNYQGLIRCIPTKSLVYFQVIGPKAQIREKLLNQLKRNF
jgi:hypothetical protein